MTGGLDRAAAAAPAADGQGHAEHGGACLNCGTGLIGPHCHSCGQSAHLHRSVGAIGHEIAHGVFHFEGKIWRTLPLLALRPGELTRRYAAGERAKFVSPLAMFLFTVFLMFAIVASLPGYKFYNDDLLKADVRETLGETRDDVIAERKTEQARLVRYQQRLQAERAKPAPDAGEMASLAQSINRTSASIRELARIEASIPGPQVQPVATGENWFESKFRYIREHRELVAYKIKTNAYKYSWALIPLSIPFLWLLFPFSRRFHLYDHAVFATYSLTFMSLLVIALAVLGAVGVRTWLLVTAATILPVLHIYRQIKGAYSLGRWSAVLRTFVLLNLILWVIVPVFAAALVYLGVG